MPPVQPFAQPTEPELENSAQSAETPTAPGPTPGDNPALDQLEQRIKYLHERLHITPAQEPLWANVAQAMRDNAKSVAPLLRERFRSAQTANLPDYLNAFEKLGDAQLAGLKTFAAAFEALYGDMSPQQKKIADVILRLSPLATAGSIFQLPGTLTYPPRDDYAMPALASLPPTGYPFPPFGQEPPFAPDYASYAHAPPLLAPPAAFGFAPFSIYSPFRRPPFNHGHDHAFGHHPSTPPFRPGQANFAFQPPHR